MKVKLRMISNKVDSNSLLIEMSRMQLTTKVYVEKYPATKDVGVVTILEDFDPKDNDFQILVKNINGNVLGKGNVFRIRLMTEDNTAIVLYNVNKAYFENKNGGYIIELYNKDKMIDNYTLTSDTNIYNIYKNLDDKGSIEL